MNVTHKIKLDLQQSGARQTLHVKQGDSMSRQVALSLYDDGAPWAVPEGTVLQIAYYKPDKTGGLYDTMPDGTVACSAADNVVTALLHPQMFTAIGLVACELRLLNQNGVHISTFSWYMLVDAAITDALESEDYFKCATIDGLQQQIGDLDALITQEKRTLVAAVNEVLARAIQSVNGKAPSPAGNVCIAPEDLAVALHTLPYQGTLDGALELLAQEALRAVPDKTAAFAAWRAQHGATLPLDYARTLPDGDYCIVSDGSEYRYHKFTADAIGWLTEWTYEEDAILYFSIYCNDIPMLQYDSSGSVIFDAATTVSGLALPKADSDAANKAYVDKTIENATGEIWDYLSLDLEDAPNFWERVQYLVRAGKAAALFPVGYEFTATDADTGAKIVWVVRGHDHHKPADNALQHSMTLETKYVYSDANGAYKGLQFDAPEALYYAENGLAPGTYHFTVANQNWYAGDNGKTFQFTLTQEVPEGGQVYLSMTYNATIAGKSVRTYADASATDAIETATLTEGAEGTSLGTTNGVGNINHMHRIALGSNNYAQSAARQWLNSDASAGSVWTPQTKYDRPPSWAAAYNGFMHGLPADFLTVVAPAVIPCQTNSIYECASLDGTAFAVDQEYNLTDKFFLLSRPEVYGLSDSTTIKDGELLSYYDGLTNPERKKYDNGGTGRRAWLRSPYPAHATTERIVDLDGSGNITTANSSLGVAPACIIA